jgi:DNA-binding LacI/PurR family transcriptional regulator
MPSARRRVTSVDVAAEAGVSQATVARAFSSPDRVAPATRAKVEAAALRLGYTPNAIARSLKLQRTNIIGAAVPAYGEYWQHVLIAFSRQLAAHGKQLLLFSLPEEADTATIRSAVHQYRLDGIVFAPATITQKQLIQVFNDDVPTVAFNQPSAWDAVPTVAVDNEAGMREVARHLIDIGARSVQFVGGDPATSTDQLRYRGAALEWNDAGIACPYVAAGDFSYDTGYKISQHIVDADELPDVVMVAGDELAFGVIDGLNSAGLSVPDDILVTGFDGLPQASWAGYDLTTLVQPTDSLVERAIDALLDPHDRPRDYIPGTLRIGRTTTRSAAARTAAVRPDHKDDTSHA